MGAINAAHDRAEGDHIMNTRKDLVAELATDIAALDVEPEFQAPRCCRVVSAGKVA